MLFARAIYASGSPLQLVENEHWASFFKKIRPSWKMLSRYKLSKEHLEEEYNFIRTKVNTQVAEACSLGLMCDGWTNIRREPIINYVVTTPTPYFFKSVPTGANSHTATYVAEEISKVMEEIGPKKVLGVVTDNAASMKAAWKILGDKYNHLVAYGCIAHGLNLLAHDLVKLDSISNIVNNGKSIVKEITLSHRLDAIFKEKQSGKKLSLKLPVKTRWGSHVSFMKSLLLNKNALRMVAIDDRVEKLLTETSKNDLLSDKFWATILHLYELLKPVANWITIIEGDSPQISLVCKIFDDLKKHFTEIVTASPTLIIHKQAILKLLQNRSSFCVTPIHKAANLLDPTLRGQNLSTTEMLDGTEFIANVAKNTDGVDESTVLAEYAKYKVKEELWSKDFLWKAAGKVSASTWWNGLCPSTHLSKVATRILLLPATSAACERTFSTYGNTHTAKRNRLTNERAGKLVYIRHNLKLLNKRNSHSKPLVYPEVGKRLTPNGSATSIAEKDDTNIDEEVIMESSSELSDYSTDSDCETSDDIYEEPGSEGATKNIDSETERVPDVNCEASVKDTGDRARPASPNMIDLKEGDYAVVRMSTKKNFKHFVCLVQKKSSLDECIVKFMKRRAGPINAFVFPSIEEVSSVNFEEFKGMLGQPTVDRREVYTFIEDLSLFQNLC